MIKQFCLLLVCFCSWEFGYSQAALLYNDGTPVTEKKPSDIEGDEFFHPDWQVGHVRTKAGKVYSGVKLKYNQREDQFYFLGANGLTMVFTSPVKEVVFGDSAVGRTNVFRNGFPVVARLSPDSYFEVLVDGKGMLLKKTVKNVVEKREYNSSVVKKQIQNDVQYYFYNGENLLPVKKSKAAFVEGTKDRSAAIERFIADNKLNLRSEDDLVKLVRFINSPN